MGTGNWLADYEAAAGARGYKFAVEARQIIQTAPATPRSWPEDLAGSFNFWRKHGTMPGRKRANPQRVDADSPAKRRELFQFVPSARLLSTAVGLTACADSARLPHDLAATVVQPLAEISNTTSDVGEAHNLGKLYNFICV